MSITVSRLCADPTLGLTVVAGAAGAHRVISWAHTSELADPTPWLEGGELLMTLALNLDLTAASQYAYVERLAGAGVAALAVDTGMIHPVVPAGLLSAGDAFGLPVLAVPAATPFLAISRAVISAVTAAQIRAFQQTSKDQERLASAALLTGKSGVVETLAKVLGGSVLLLDAKGRTLVSAGPDRVQLATRVTNRLQAYAARQAGSARQAGFTHVDDDGHLVVHALDAPATSRGYLALGTADALTSSERLLISHAITLLSIVLDRPTQLRRTETRLRRAVFRSLLRQGADTDLALVKFFGFTRTAPVAVSWAACAELSRATPKSSSFTASRRGDAGRWHRKTLPGFRSRCTMPRSCAAARPRVHWAVSSSALCTLSGPRSRRARSVSPSSSSVTR